MTTIIPDKFATTPLDYYHEYNAGGITGYKIVNSLTASTLTSRSINASEMQAYPFVLPSGAQCDQIAVYVTTLGAPTFLRIGVYQNYSDNNLCPSGLMYDSGPRPIGATGKITTAPTGLYLEGGKVYWCAIVTSGNIDLKAVDWSASYSPFGADDNMSDNLQTGLGYTMNSSLPLIFGENATPQAQLNLPIAFGMKLTSFLGYL